MSRLADVFARQKPVLAGYVTVGYPTLDSTRRLVPRLAAAGCDVIELGIPFSDPLADGATIQNAAHQALLAGVTPQICLDVAKDMRAQTEAALAFMTYYNLILNYGLPDFCRRAAQSGIDALIIPDLPPDEGEPLRVAACAQGIDLIYLLAPTSTEQRIRLVAERAQGFIYLVSLTGVTGARATLSDGLESFVDRVRAVTRQPLAVGFGISNPEQAARVARIADGVIIGSRLLQLVEQDDDKFTQTTSFVREVKRAMQAAAGVVK